MISTPIYKRDTSGKIRTWQYEVEGEKYRTISGIQDGNLVTTGWRTAKAKNIGRSNETTPIEQAALEAAADEVKKLKREYRRTTPELEFVPNGPMLAEKWPDFKGEVSYAHGVWSQPKLDGIRAMMTTKWGATSRELQPHFNCEHLMNALAPLFAQHPDIEFDGELYNHDFKDDFNGLGSIIRKQKSSPEQKVKAAELIQFHIYDLPSSLPFSERTAKLKALLKELNHPMLIYVPTTKVANLDELDAAQAEALAAGYEGQMVRLNGPYAYDGRPWDLMKRKIFITEEFPVKRIEEGEGNWAGYAKRIVLDIPEAPDGEVGAGMRGNQDFAKKLLGRTDIKLATIRHFGKTPDGSLRFPVAIDFHTAAGRVD